MVQLIIREHDIVDCIGPAEESITLRRAMNEYYNLEMFTRNNIPFYDPPTFQIHHKIITQIINLKYLYNNNEYA